MALKALDHRNKLSLIHLKDDQKRLKHIEEAQQLSRKLLLIGLKNIT